MTALRISLFLSIALTFGSASAAATLLPGKDMDATAIIATQCSISATGVAFGTYYSATAHRTNNLDAQTTPTVTCTAGTSGVYLMLQKGTGTGPDCTSTPTKRSMKFGAEVLTYDLYQDSGRTVAWGCDAANWKTMPEFVNSTTAQGVDVFGRIPMGQSGNAGSYTDTVSFQVVF